MSGVVYSLASIRDAKTHASINKVIDAKRDSVLIVYDEASRYSVDLGMREILAEVATVLVKHLKADEHEVNAYLYSNIEVILPADSQGGLTMPESRQSPAPKLASSKPKSSKTGQSSLNGRANEIYLVLKKLRKSVNADK